MGKNATETWMENLKPEDLDLHQLDAELESAFSRDFDNPRLFESEAMKQFMDVKEKYKQMYGDTWIRHYLSDMSEDYDTRMKIINTSIYCGRRPGVSGLGAFEFIKKYELRMKELYGDKYDELKIHVKGDSRVAQLLLEDAIKTGKWKELPDCLQEEYHAHKTNTIGGTIL